MQTLLMASNRFAVLINLKMDILWEVLHVSTRKDPQSIQTSPNKALNTSSIPAKNWELFVNISMISLFNAPNWHLHNPKKYFLLFLTPQ